MIEFRANGVNLTGDIQSENTALNIANESFSDRLRPVGTFTDFNISLPSSAVNDSILEVAGTKDFEVLFYGTPIAIGTARVLGAMQNGNSYVRTGRRWNLQTNLSNADWIDRLRLVRFNELDWTDANHIMNDATILARLNVAYDTHRFGYHLARTREWPLDTRVRVQDFTPFVWLRDAIEKSMQAVGYTIKGSGGFINTALMKSMAMPLPLLRDNIEWAIDALNAVIDRITTAQEITVTNNDLFVNFPLIFNNVVLDAGGNTALVSGQERYYVNFTGEFAVTIEAIYETQEGAAAANVTFSHELQLFNDSGFVSAVVFEGGTIGLSQNVETPFTATALINVNSLALNPYLRVVIKPLTITPGVGNDPRLIDFLTGSRLLIEASQADMGNRPIDVAGLIPDEWSPLAMVRDLFFIFCGRSNNNEFIKVWDIEPADNYETAAGLSDGYYLDSGQYRVNADLSKEANIEYREIEITAVQYDWMRASEDATMEGEEERQDTEFYSGLVQLNSNLPAKVEQRRTEFFAKTLQIEDTDIRVGKGKSPLIPVYADYDIRRDNSFLLPESFTPRLLIYKYFASGADANGFVIYQDTDGVPDFITPVMVPFMAMVNYYDTTGHSDSLSFMDEVTPFGTVKGLMSAFHRHDLARLQVGIELTEYLIYPITRLLQPQPFRNKILVGDRLYIVRGVRSFRGGLPSQQVVLVPDSKAGDAFTVIPKGRRAVAGAVSTGNEIELIATPIIIDDELIPPDWVSGPTYIFLTENNTIWYVDSKGDSININLPTDPAPIPTANCRKVVTDCGAEFTFALHDENAVFLDTGDLVVTVVGVPANSMFYVKVFGAILTNLMLKDFHQVFAFQKVASVLTKSQPYSTIAGNLIVTLKLIDLINSTLNPFELLEDWGDTGAITQTTTETQIPNSDYWYKIGNLEIELTKLSTFDGENDVLRIARPVISGDAGISIHLPTNYLPASIVNNSKILIKLQSTTISTIFIGLTTNTVNISTPFSVVATGVQWGINVFTEDSAGGLYENGSLVASFPITLPFSEWFYIEIEQNKVNEKLYFRFYDSAFSLLSETIYNWQGGDFSPQESSLFLQVYNIDETGLYIASIDIESDPLSSTINQIAAQVIISGTNLQDVECEDITFNLGCTPDCPTNIDGGNASSTMDGFTIEGGNASSTMDGCIIDGENA